MQFSTIFTVLAAAMTVSARPGAGGDTTITSCSSQQANTCCDTSGLADVLDLKCLVTIIGGACSGQAYCCETAAEQGSGININALNCVKVA